MTSPRRVRQSYFSGICAEVVEDNFAPRVGLTQELDA